MLACALDTHIYHRPNAAMSCVLQLYKYSSPILVFGFKVFEFLCRKSSLRRVCECSDLCTNSIAEGRYRRISGWKVLFMLSTHHLHYQKPDRQTDRPWSILQILSEFVCIQQFVISGVNNSWRWSCGFSVKRSWNKFMMTDPQIKDCAPISAYPHVCFFITFSCRLLVFYQKVTRIEDKETVKVNIHLVFLRPPIFRL